VRDTAPEPGREGPTEIRGDADVAKAVERFTRDNPKIAEAMRVFEISDQAYAESLRAMLGHRVVWTGSANRR